MQASCVSSRGGCKPAASKRRSRLAKLRAVGDPIDFRKQEVAARAALATKAARFVELATGALGDWPKSKPWLNETDTADIGKQVPPAPPCWMALLVLFVCIASANHPAYGREESI